MDKLDKRSYEIVKRLQNARLSLLSKQPFYALLLLHMKFSLDLTCSTAYTDGDRIAFNPDFMEALSDRELEFVLMHEVLHTALGHPFRKQSDYDLECFDKACDIVVNSNILYSFDMNISRITLKNFGVSMHTTPGGKEGYLFSVEQVYDELMSASNKHQKNPPPSDDSQANNAAAGGGDEDEEESTSPDEHGEQESQKNDAAGEQDNNTPPSASDNEKDDKSSGNGKKGGTAPSSSQGNTEEKCTDDITREDLDNLIAELLKGRAVHGKIDPNSTIAEIEGNTDKQGFVDDHSFWNGDEEDNIGRDTWMQRMIDATDIIAQSESMGKSRGAVPIAATRLIEELKEPLLDWRTILNEFVQEEICDYSFSPPDRRMEDSPFFLPDFNEKDESVKDILFMIDTSGSMSNEEITDCYSEIYGAILQFGGKLQGKLGFFDAVVVEPIPFEDEDEFKIIRPVGGGGTSFDIIFQYVQEKMWDDPPVSIVILTDGYAPFPEESCANGIPVLWIINNTVVNPPWGKVARIVENAP